MAASQAEVEWQARYGQVYMSKRYFLIAAVNGLLAVALGAFGAHGLKQVITAEMLEVYQTAVQYQMFHVTGLLAVAVLARQHAASSMLKFSGALFTIGIAVFCGSLYLLAVSGITMLGFITPFGGVCFLAAWGLLIIHVCKHESS